MNKTSVKKRIWFLNRDPHFGRGDTVEFIPGRKVTVRKGFCCAVKRTQKAVIKEMGYKVVKAITVPRKIRDELVAVMKP